MSDTLSPHDFHAPVEAGLPKVTPKPSVHAEAMHLRPVQHTVVGGWLAHLVDRGLANPLTEQDDVELVWAARGDDDGRLITTGLLGLAAGVLAPDAVEVTLHRDAAGVPTLVVRSEADPCADRGLARLALRTAEALGEPFRGKALLLDRAYTGRMGTWTVHPWITRIEATEAPVLDTGLIQRVTDEVVGYTDRMERLRAAGLGARRGILLHGPPGTGKTHLIRHLAHATLGTLTWLLPGAQVINESLEELYDLAVRLSPSVVVLEDLDVVAQKARASRASSFLNVLDGVVADGAVVTIATTNDLPALGEAATRSGRFDLILEVPAPDRDLRRRMWATVAEQLDVEADVERLAVRSQGLTGADIREVARRAVMEGAAVNTDVLVREVQRMRDDRDGYPSTGTYL